jgi:3-hydroxymyristoyl/3-hydroxydecanoyl-(acyl carrier protein) dehydratase
VYFSYLVQCEQMIPLKNPRDETDLIASISASLLVIAKTVFTQIDNFQYQNQLVDTDKLFLHVEVQSNLVAKLEKYNVLYRVLKICR